MTSLLLAYALGCISFASLVARAHGVDIRTVGSGNPGATNVRRALGSGWGLGVLLLDMLKGVVAVLWLEAPPGAGVPIWLVDDRGRVLVAAAVVLGHCFPVTSGFRGGKGVATLVGALLALDPVLAALAIGVHTLARRLVGFVSLASVVLAWSFPLLQQGLVLGGPPSWAGARFLQGSGALALLALLITLRHRANFARIRAGTESRYDASPPTTRSGA